METINGLWEWYVAGPLLGVFVPLLLWFGNKQFGLSTSLESICHAALPGGKKILKNFVVADNIWRVYFVAGIIIGGFIAGNYLTEIPLAFLPDSYFSVNGMITLLIGGLLVGFGTRYANGCTSGHAIFGLSILSGTSLVATISFFIGGLLYTALLIYF